MNKIAYARVSTAEQNEGRQIEELKKYTDNIIIEKQTGKKVNKKLEEIINEMDEYTYLYVYSLDRFGRNTRNNLNLIEQIKDKKASLFIAKEGISIKRGQIDAVSNLYISILSGVAEYEVSLINHRAKKGIKSRKSIKKIQLNGYNKQQEEKIKKLKNKAFRNDVLNARGKEKREAVMEKYGIKKTAFYTYRSLIINK